jgi:hypothetical protein
VVLLKSTPCVIVRTSYFVIPCPQEWPARRVRVAFGCTDVASVLILAAGRVHGRSLSMSVSPLDPVEAGRLPFLYLVAVLDTRPLVRCGVLLRTDRRPDAPDLEAVVGGGLRTLPEIAALLDRDGLQLLVEPVAPASGDLPLTRGACEALFLQQFMRLSRAGAA